MRIAMIYDAHDESGTATFGAERERLGEQRERERLAEYLRSGRLVLSTTGRDQDRLDPARGRVVPISFRTDGEWVWSEALAYYVAEYGIAPEGALRDHAADREYEMPDVSDDAARAASRLVLER